MLYLDSIEINWLCLTDLSMGEMTAISMRETRSNHCSQSLWWHKQRMLLRR